ncbi:MAG: DUF262 domain-containing protein [Clostridia bacterium]|nr:DUF262 domain-containing protein [Clostridia bacterium]
MRINPELIQNANMNPTKETRQQTIDDLCTSIDQGTLVLPLYQRDLSWTLEKCVELLNYQLSGKAPVSAISYNIINRTEDAVQQISFITRELVDMRPGLNSVIDGQQRIATNYKAYIGHPDFKDVVLDLKKGRFIIKPSDAEPKPHQIPVGVLLHRDIEEFRRYLGRHPALSKLEVQNALLLVRNKFKSYHYTINQGKDLSEDEQIKWFEVLNNAGSRVTVIQMRLAKLKIYDIDIYDDYTRVYVARIKERGLERVFEKQSTDVSYPISALNPAYEVIVGQAHSFNYCPMAPDTKENQICNLKPDQIRRAIKMTLDALDRVFSFIDTHHLKSPDRIDYINFLLGYFVFYPDALSAQEEQRLIDWYRKVDFSNTSNTERRAIFYSLLQRG